MPSLVAPPTVATREPDVAPEGTEVVIEVLDHEVAVAVAPLNLMVLLPCVAPNPVPVITTVSPVLPEVGVTAVMFSPEATVKLIPLLEVPPTEIMTLPVVAPVGTGTVIEPSLQFAAVAVVPLNLTVLEPCVAPNPAPVIVTVAPIPPFVGARLEIPGPDVTVKVELLLGPLFTVTTTGPVVAPAGAGTFISPEAQLVGAAGTPLKVTELAP